MKGPISAVIFYIVFKVNLCFAKHGHNHFNKMEEHVQIPCDNNEQCEEMELHGYKCVDFLCTCEDSSKCLEVKLKTMVTKIGHNCSVFARCSVEQSFCNSKGECDCIQETVSSKDKRRCLNETLQIGLACEEDVQCAALNGVCSEGKCRCYPNMHTKKGICYNITALGSPCQRNEECTDYSKCNNICTCDKEYIRSGSKCLSKAQGLRSHCSEDIQCSSTLGFGSVCANGFCMCLDLYHYKANINKCVIDALLGEVCANHTDCHQPEREDSRLDCILGECKCQPAYYEKEGYCLERNAGSSLVPFSFKDILPFVFTYMIFYVIL